MVLEQGGLRLQARKAAKKEKDRLRVSRGHAPQRARTLEWKRGRNEKGR